MEGWTEFFGNTIVGLRLQRDTWAFNFESPKLSFTYLQRVVSILV